MNQSLIFVLLAQWYSLYFTGHSDSGTDDGATSTITFAGDPFDPADPVADRSGSGAIQAAGQSPQHTMLLCGG